MGPSAKVCVGGGGKVEEAIFYILLAVDCVGRWVGWGVYNQGCQSVDRATGRGREWVAEARRGRELGLQPRLSKDADVVECRQMRPRVYKNWLRVKC
jgi:hypothetical protein